MPSYLKALSEMSEGLVFLGDGGADTSSQVFLRHDVAW